MIDLGSATVGTWVGGGCVLVGSDVAVIVKGRLKGGMSVGIKVSVTVGADVEVEVGVAVEVIICNERIASKGVSGCSIFNLPTGELEEME